MILHKEGKIKIKSVFSFPIKLNKIEVNTTRRNKKVTKMKKNSIKFSMYQYQLTQPTKLYHS